MDVLPLDCVVNIILLLFVVTQIIFGLFALYFLSRQQVIKFQLQQFYDETMGVANNPGFELEPIDT